MDRAEAAGLGIAVVGHLGLLAALSFGFVNAAKSPVFAPPMEISFVEDVGLESAAPSTEPAAAAVAPDFGPPEEASPPTPDIATPDPVPPPEPEPAPVAKPAPKPAPTPKPSAKPQPEKKPEPKAAPKSQPKEKAAAQAQPKEQPKAVGKGGGEKSTGSRLGKDFLKGIGSDPVAKSTKPSGAVMSASAMASIDSAIRRQIQPCANRQVNPGPGANRITVRLNLKLNRNGSLASRPTVVGTLGVDDENRRYEQRVEDLAVNALTSCTPLKGLPEELYDVPRGWSNFIFRYKLPD